MVEQGISENLDLAGWKSETHDLAWFQDDYGLKVPGDGQDGGDDDEDDDDDDDEEEDDEDEDEEETRKSKP
jgi:hypothetical protein